MQTHTSAVSHTRSGGWTRAVSVAIFVTALDQLTKALIRNSIPLGSERKVLGPLRFAHVHNKGVAFGFLGGSGALVLIVTFGALALPVFYFMRHPERPLLWLPTGLLLGGAFGNIIDRLRQGYVTDFIHSPGWPAFNLADVSITLGVITLVLVFDRHARATQSE